MDQQRPFLYLTLFFLGFLLWSTWQEEHAPKPVESTIGKVTQATAGQNNSMPSGSSITTGVDMVPVNTPAVEAIKTQQIHVKTNVLDIIISTQGGTIVQADLPTHSVSLEEKIRQLVLLIKK